MNAETSTAPAPRVVSPEEQEKNKGTHLFRLYVVDVESDPLEPVIKLLWKRGDDYQATQKLARAVLSSSAPEGDFLYEDEACTSPFEVPEDASWHLAQTRKHKSGTKAAGVDKEWLRIHMAREDLTPEQKLAEIQKYL